MRLFRKTGVRLNLAAVMAIVAALLVFSGGAAVAVGMIGSAEIVDGGIKAIDLGSGSVKSGKIAGGAVNSAKIADGSIKAADIATGTIRVGKIANGAVNSAKILDGSILAADLAAGAVSSAKILDGSITGADVADNTIGAAKINRNGLDADSFDGLNSGMFVKKNSNSIISGELTATGFNYAAPKTEYLSINVSAFNPVQSGLAFGGRSSGYLYAEGTGTPSYWQAPVQLPHGATVKKMRFRLKDADGTYSLSVRLQRLASDGGAAPEMAGIATTTTGTPGWQLLEDNSISASVIDNQNYDYFVDVLLEGQAGDNIALGQGMITYEINKP